ncbi:MAG: YitT family protein [Sporomusaceae bacterium]|nr:YitT family protein [Sporomusaceae bacterium]
MNGKLRDYAGITLGALLTAAALNVFLVPNRIADGGVSGLAIVLHYLSGWPVGMIMLAVNIPLLLCGVKVLGASFGIYTLYGAIVLSFAVDLLAPYMPILTRDLLLSAVYGGVLNGLGMGIVFRFGGTTAGTDVAAAILNKWFGVSLGQALFGVDIFVITVAGLVFRSVELPLYGLISLFITAKVIDLVQEGWGTSKAFFIMSEHNGKISCAIQQEIGRGVTFFHGRGGYSGESRDILFCVVAVREVSRVKDLVSRIDRRAFLIVADAHEVLGEGFKELRY